MSIGDRQNSRSIFDRIVGLGYRDIQKQLSPLGSLVPFVVFRYSSAALQLRHRFVVCNRPHSKMDSHYIRFVLCESLQVYHHGSLVECHSKIHKMDRRRVFLA